MPSASRARGGRWGLPRRVDRSPVMKMAGGSAYYLVGLLFLVGVWVGGLIRVRSSDLDLDFLVKSCGGTRIHACAM